MQIQKPGSRACTLRLPENETDTNNNSMDKNNLAEFIPSHSLALPKREYES